MKFKDCNGSSIISMGKSDRAKLLEHLGNASKSVSDARHPVHGHLLKAAGIIGAIKDRSEDDSDDPGNLTSPGRESRNVPARELGARQPDGGSDIAQRAVSVAAMDLFKFLAKGGAATFEERRAEAVRGLYKSSSKAGTSAEKNRFAKLAYELDKLSASDVERAAVPVAKHQVIGSHRPLRSFQERHGF
jgi:hypothetical protein